MDFLQPKHEHEIKTSRTANKSTCMSLFPLFLLPQVQVNVTTIVTETTTNAADQKFAAHLKEKATMLPKYALVLSNDKDWAATVISFNNHNDKEFSVFNEPNNCFNQQNIGESLKLLRKVLQSILKKMTPEEDD